jgi:hypothetical protein
MLLSPALARGNNAQQRQLNTYALLTHQPRLYFTSKGAIATLLNKLPNRIPNSRITLARVNTALDIRKKASNRKPRAYDDDNDSWWDDDDYEYTYYGSYDDDGK